MRINDRNQMSALKAAKYLGVHVGTLANWRYYGVGPKYEKSGNRVIYSKRSVIKFKRGLEALAESRHG